MKPTNYDELYPGRFLKAGLLKGQKVTLTIKDVDIEQLEDNTGKPKTKAIIAFLERPLELVACKTNGICLKSMFGKELSNWIGKKVTLFPGQWNGEECIRIWGSPEIEADFNVNVELPRRKPFTMTMHKIVSKPEAVSSPISYDPRVQAALGIIGITSTEASAMLASFNGDQGKLLSHLNQRIDELNEQAG